MQITLIFPLSGNYRQIPDSCLLFQGYEGSLLKVTSKNGKTASPVGFVTFASRASAEAAKQDLQVGDVAILCLHLATIATTVCLHLPLAAAMAARVAMDTRLAGLVAGKSAVAAMFTTTEGSQSEAESWGLDQSEDWKLLL